MSSILNLNGFKVLQIDETEHDYHITSETTLKHSECPHCHSVDVVGFGKREQLIRDLPIHGKRVGIYVDTKRYQCKSCQKTFYETLPETDLKRQMTTRLKEWIGHKAVKNTFASIAEDIGVAEGTVKAVFNDYVNQLEKSIRFETPKWMGIDEIHLIKPRGVITNIQNNTVVEVLVNRNKETMIQYLAGLPEKQTIRYVAMDMWKPYRDAVERVLPHAMIVIDKFHVVRMANDALDKVRKSLRSELEPKQRRYLKNDRFILLKRRHELSEQEEFIMSGWLENYPQLALAYSAKEAFYEIYDSNNLMEANKRYSAWREMIKPEIHSAYADLIRAFENWQPYILNYFQHPVTNAYTESLNNLIRIMNRLGRGYSFEALRAKILFSEGALKPKYKRPKFERRSRELEEPRFMMKMIHDRSLPDDQPIEREIEGYFGADISTLIEKIENGEL
ncbi:MAG: ISL3 family transposase [Hydrogenovibrio crunogenus]|nr:ISL3 family transposase [Hydrogenovibrio crunogenus]